METFNRLFDVLKSSTRRKILKLLIKEEMHVSGIARALNISTAQASKHVKMLEEEGLVDKKTFGRTKVLRTRMNMVYRIFDTFSDEHSIEVEEGTTVLDALSQISGIKVDSVGERNFVVSVDGEDGYYVYEVNRKLPQVPMDRLKLREDATVDLKKIVHVSRKRMNVRVRKY